MAVNRFYETGKKLKPSDFEVVEKQLGISLPPDLKSHYLNRNGGRPGRNYFVTDDEFELHEFKIMRYPRDAVDRGTLFEDTYKRLVLEKKLIPETLVPFATNSGGDFYCIHRKTQAIYFYAMDHSDNPRKAMEKIAESLEAFISGMVREEDLEDDDDEDFD